MIYNLANKVPSSIEMKHNTAKSHNNFDAMSTQNDATQVFSTNHTSSFSYATNIWSNSIHDHSYNKDQAKDGKYAVESINVLFIAFGRIFDIVLQPDHKQIQKSMKTDTSIHRDSPSIFYHGHLKGMQENSEVSLTFHDMELVRLVYRLLR